MEDSAYDSLAFDESTEENQVPVKVPKPGDIDMETTIDSYERVLSHYVYDEIAVKNDLESRQIHDRLNAMAGVSSSKCESKTQEYARGFGKWLKDIDFLLGQIVPGEDDSDHDQDLHARLSKCREKAEALDALAAGFMSVS